MSGPRREDVTRGAEASDSIVRLLAMFPDADGLVVDPTSGGAVAVSPCCSSTGVIYDGMTLVTSKEAVAAAGVPLYERAKR